MLSNGFIANTVVATASTTAGVVTDSSDDPSTAEDNDPQEHFCKQTQVLISLKLSPRLMKMEMDF